MTMQSAGRAPDYRTTLFADIAIGCFVYFVLALLLLHALRPEYAPATTFISGYAVGPYGWVMTTAWLAASSGCLMLVLGLARTSAGSAATRIGTFLMAILSLGLLVTAIFPPSRRGEESISGEIHSITFLVNVVCILLASILLSVGARSDPRWASFRSTAATLASLLVFAFILQFTTAYFEALYGLANRFFATVLMVWLLAIATKLRALAQG